MAARNLPAHLGMVQRERLAHIDFRLYFVGDVSRAHIIARFGVSPPVATRDLALYRALAPENIVFDGSAKLYRIGPGFAPLFEHNLERVLTMLAKGFGDGLGGTRPVVPCEFAGTLNRPEPDVVAAVTRAIAVRAALSIRYFSVASGATTREIVPHALADNGLRWHVRAFDRGTSSFRDIVLTRIFSPTFLPGSGPEEGEGSQDDAEWNAFLDLEVIAHPKGARPEITALDFPIMDGVLPLRVRAAMAGYALRRWSVDCSDDHQLDPVTHPLWLRNSMALEGVAGAGIAPGRERLEVMWDCRG